MSQDQKPAASPPMGFAIMRNAHEAFRQAIKELSLFLSEGKLEEFNTAWAAYKRVTEVHKVMEDENMFPLMTAFAGEGEADTSTLSSAHTKDDEEIAQVDASIAKALASEAGSPERDTVTAELSTIFNTWKEDHEEHFKAEETIMMARTQKVAPTPLERCYVVHKVIVTPSYERNAEEFLYFIGKVTELLSRFGSTGQDALTATRVFVRALRSDSNAEQWDKFMPVCKSSCASEEIWQQLIDTFKIEEADCAHLNDDQASDAAKQAVAYGLKTAAPPTASAAAGTGDAGNTKTAASGGGGGCCVIA